MNSMARVRAIVRGEVQGVGYRMSARREAARHGLSGWVQNQPDGSVVVEAQGERAQILAFLSWCRLGPAGAEVSDVEVKWVPELASGVDTEERFEIRH
jgi:acylphosphatase